MPFDFLRAELPHVHEGAVKAAEAALSDPRTACFHARWTVEQAIGWAYEHDRALPEPWDKGVSARLNEPAFKGLVGEGVYRFAREVIRLGNHAAHKPQPLTHHDSVAAVSHLFQFCFWFARTYAKVKPPADLRFDPRLLSQPPRSQLSTPEQVQELQRALEESELARRRAQDELADRARIEAELEQLRAEVAAAKAKAAATPDEHDYSEAETRDFFIDLLLNEVGWKLDEPRDREFEVAGMPNKENKGFVDYVLWGDDGKPLAVVEAKRTKRDPREGQQQAKLYADCLEQAYGQRPVIFYSNGYEHWLWDDAFYPPRHVQGFYEKDELELLIRRRTTRGSLADTEIDSSIVERYYQTRAIRRIGESLERDHARKALIVMATGAGKTRTVVALADLLIRANWAKRILFLADRTALVNQATGVFKAFLPDSSPVNLVKPLRNLTPGKRVFAYVGGAGYVGVGEVVGEMIPLRDLVVTSNGTEVRVVEQPEIDPEVRDRAASGDEDITEYAVPVRWLAERNVSDAIAERGLFASQVTVCKLRDERTIEVVTAAFDLDGDDASS